MHDKSNLLIIIAVSIISVLFWPVLSQPNLEVGSSDDTITLLSILVAFLGSVILLLVTHLIYLGR